MILYLLDVVVLVAVNSFPISQYFYGERGREALLPSEKSVSQVAIMDKCNLSIYCLSLYLLTY